MPVAVVFLLRAVVLVLLWGFVVAAIVAVRHDVFGTKASSRRRSPAPSRPAPPPQPAPAPAPVSAADPPKPRSRRGRKATPTSLAVIEGPAAGTSVALSSLPVTIGRSDTSTVVLADDYVSSHHARLVPHGEDWLVEDTGSTNGTFVGNTKVTAPVVVPVGSRIRIGRNTLELR